MSIPNLVKTIRSISTTEQSSSTSSTSNGTGPKASSTAVKECEFVHYVHHCITVLYNYELYVNFYAHLHVCTYHIARNFDQSKNSLLSNFSQNTN